MRSVCTLLVLAALSPASALRPATLTGRRAPASAAIDRRALLGAAVFAVAAPRSAHAALRGDEDPVIRDVQNLLEFEEIKKNGVEGLTPTASVKVGGLKGDIKVELNVDANGDQKYLWFTDAATRQVLKAKIVQGAKVRRRPAKSIFLMSAHLPIASQLAHPTERIATHPQDRGSFSARLPRGITVIPTQVCALLNTHRMTRASCVCACTGPPHGTLSLFGIHIFMLIFFILIRAVLKGERRGGGRAAARRAAVKVPSKNKVNETRHVAGLAYCDRLISTG